MSMQVNIKGLNPCRHCKGTTMMIKHIDLFKKEIYCHNCGKKFRDASNSLECLNIWQNDNKLPKRIRLFKLLTRIIRFLTKVIDYINKIIYNN